MTKLLTRAMTKISKLPERDQDALASWILDELKLEERWTKLFGKSQALLEKTGIRSRDNQDGGEET